MRLAGKLGGEKMGSVCSKQMRCLWGAVWGQLGRHALPSLELGGQADTGEAGLGRKKVTGESPAGLPETRGRDASPQQTPPLLAWPDLQFAEVAESGHNNLLGHLRPPC